MASLRTSLINRHATSKKNEDEEAARTFTKAKQ